MERLRQTLQGVLAEDDVAAVDHVVHVDVERIDEQQFRVVARRQREIGVLERFNEQRLPFHADAADFLGQVLRLRVFDREVADQDEMPFLDALGESRLEGGLLLLRVHLVRVVAGRRSEDRAAVTVDGRAVAALTGAAGALLPVGLLARAAHFGAVLHLVRALAETGQVVAHRLVDEVLLVGIGEDLFGQVDRADLLVVPVFDVNGRHGYSPRFPFFAKRTTTRPFFPPGTAPRMYSRLFSTSILATRRFLTVT